MISDFGGTNYNLTFSNLYIQGSSAGFKPRTCNFQTFNVHLLLVRQKRVSISFTHASFNCTLVILRLMRTLTLFWQGTELISSPSFLCFYTPVWHLQLSYLCANALVHLKVCAILSYIPVWRTIGLLIGLVVVFTDPINVPPFSLLLWDSLPLPRRNSHQIRTNRYMIHFVFIEEKTTIQFIFVVSLKFSSVLSCSSFFAHPQPITWFDSSILIDC